MFDWQVAQAPSSPSDPCQVSPNTRDRPKELLRKLLLGGEIVNTQFYLFSTKSVSSDVRSRVIRPRALCANNVLLNNSAKYFSNLLRSKTSSDTSLIEIIGDDQEIPSEAPINDYGYESDSDLEDDCPLEFPERPPRSLDVESEDGVETFGDRPSSVASDIFILHPVEDQKSDESEEEPTASKAADQDSTHDAVFVQTTMLRSKNARRILVKDTAFQTWYALLYYLYTGEVTFLPLKFARMRRALSGPLEAPKCSAKSMYRLASKVGLEPLRNKALEFLRDNITAHNVLKELTSSLLRRYPPLLEMTLDVLYENIASEPVATGFSAFAKRITGNEVPHGAAIVVGLHRRLLKKHYPDALEGFESPFKKKATGTIKRPKKSSQWC